MFRRPKLSEIGAEEPRTTITEFFANRGGRFVLVIAVACAVAAIGLGAWPWDYLRDTTTIETVRNIVIAAAVPPSVFMALWRASVAQKNADTANRDSNTARRTLHNERYQQCVEMLANDEAMVRLGGIYAIRDLALESKRHHLPQTLNILCAFVRHPTGPDGAQNKAREDVRAAALAAQFCARDNGAIVQEVGLVLDFTRARLSGVDLRGLKNIPLVAEGAFLRNACFVDAVLIKAKLAGTRLNRADFTKADLTGADLSGAVLVASQFAHAILKDADLSGAELGYNVELYSNKKELQEAGWMPGELLVRGLTQGQLDQAVADPENPPNLDGVLDADTGLQLTWDRFKQRLPDPD